MKDKKILGMPIIYSICVVSVLIVGIVIGSFCDYQINVKIQNVTEIGSFFATYGSYFSYCLYPAAGMAIYKGLIKKDKKNKFAAWVMLILAYFFAVFYSNSYSGSKVRALFGYSSSDPNFGISLLAYLFWVVLYAWVPAVCYFVLDDNNGKLLICVGLTILVAGIVSDSVNVWLKQVASRPRFKYLLTLDDPYSEFRNWWEWRPYLAGSNDNFKSWPSGNMTIACMMFSLPLVTGCLKKTNKYVNLAAFIIAACFVVLYGYNRMHMTNHFLTDVCFGTLITYLIHCVVSYAFVEIAAKNSAD